VDTLLRVARGESDRALNDLKAQWNRAARLDSLDHAMEFDEI
jgi:hypothetical protein